MRRKPGGEKNTMLTQCCKHTEMCTDAKLKLTTTLFPTYTLTSYPPYTHTHSLTKHTSEPVASGVCSSGGTAAGLQRSNDRTEVAGGTDEAETWREKKDYVNTMTQTY